MGTKYTSRIEITFEDKGDRVVFKAEWFDFDGSCIEGLAEGEADTKSAASTELSDQLAKSLPLYFWTEDDDEPEECSECGESLDDGEGWDGLCGNCADRAAVESVTIDY